MRFVLPLMWSPVSWVRQHMSSSKRECLRGTAWCSPSTALPRCPSLSQCCHLRSRIGLLAVPLTRQLTRLRPRPWPSLFPGRVLPDLCSSPDRPFLISGLEQPFSALHTDPSPSLYFMLSGTLVIVFNRVFYVFVHFQSPPRMQTPRERDYVPGATLVT